jgi:hypothetical protein
LFEFFIRQAAATAQAQFFVGQQKKKEFQPVGLMIMGLEGWWNSKTPMSIMPQLLSTSTASFFLCLLLAAECACALHASLL